jgi:crotonobetainyl-CoA:carnitine CoA-transferase CaiB-like acyl-CoA transferase
MFFDLDGHQQVRTPFGTAENHTRPPQLGEHTAVVLRDAGFTDSEITALHTSSAIR